MFPATARPERTPALARRAALVVAAGVLALAGGCRDSGSDRSSRGQVPELPEHDEPAALAPAQFSTHIDNEYWPMRVGTRWVYREVDESGQQLRVVVTVTSATKRIANGVTARVVRDTVTTNSAVVEDTFDWYAQDADGNVWYLGENTAEFENGKVSSREGSFEAGVDGAMAGVAMPAEPAVGAAYRQEYYAGEAEDNGEVLSIDEMAEVPAGHFDHTLLTRDTMTIEPDVLEYKLYAPGVGPVLALGISGGAGREELVSHTEVSAQTARTAATTPLGEPYR